jgi:hypothetical protein
MAVLVVQHFNRRPVEVEVVYHYGAVTRGLREASLRYRNDDAEVVHRTRLRYSTRPARPTQRHTVRLPRGEYRVAIVLRYDGAREAAEAVRRLERIEEHTDTTVSLSRPLVVTASGQAHIYLE